MIHHATLKKAEKLGIILTEKNGVVEAHWPKGNRRISASDAKVALNMGLLLARFGLEYPGVKVTGIDMYEIQVGEHNVMEGIDGSDPIDDIFSDALEAIEELGLLEEAEGGPEPEWDVVPAHYKKMYAERGNRDHCGDWLAKFLEGKFRDTDGKFDPESYETFLADNGVDLDGKWVGLKTSDTRGSIGRYRMNGRQRLEKVISVTETLKYHGEPVEIPADALAYIKAKHPIKKSKKG